MSGKEDYTVNQLAKKMGTSYRSIYRYIDTFKDSGFMVIKKSGNVYKLGKMPKNHFDLKDLSYFTGEEAYIIDSVIDNIDRPDELKERAKSKPAAICTSYLEQTGQPIQRSETEEKDCFRRSGTEPIHVKRLENPSIRYMQLVRNTLTHMTRGLKTWMLNGRDYGPRGHR